MAAHAAFERDFAALTGWPPLRWQKRLFLEHFMPGNLPASLDLPTGLGKTSVMAIWYLARKARAQIPRRLLYVVDRRAVVDQATTIADAIKTQSGDVALRVSTLRGQHVDNREWLESPGASAIVVGTVDMIGSRLLFSGYGVSRKMRPYHAGLLGADTLLVLDEAHLVRPFEKLLDVIEQDSDAFGSRCEDRTLVPSLKLLSLTATGRPRGGKVFKLVDDDLKDTIAEKRLNSKKRLQTVTVKEKRQDELATRAWELSGQGTKAVRVLVYCDKRETAEDTKNEIEKRAKKIPISTELFVGARRVKERVAAAEKLKVLGFLAGSRFKSERPTFLIATSAGEVGVDLDADHMVCDLVAWERMVQRLGRVNRLGDGDARIVVAIEPEPIAKDKQQKAIDKRAREEELDEKEEKLIEEFEAKLTKWKDFQAPIACLPMNEGGADVSPGALQHLKLRAELEPSLQAVLDSATTPVPLYPALNRALVDAWSMTSVKTHTGRPEIAPWLRGWIEEDPQTSVVWRKYLPVRTAGGQALKKEIEDFFEAAPPHLSEKLETESWRVARWLTARASVLFKAGDLGVDEIVAFALSPDGDQRRLYKLRDLVQIGSDKEQEKQLARELGGVTLVLDARMAGLRDGLLDDDLADPPQTADDGGEWMIVDGRSIVGFRIRRSDDTAPTPDKTWQESFRFDIERSDEGESRRWLVIEGVGEERKAESRNPQLLERHRRCTEAKVRDLAVALGLRSAYIDMLCLAARLHDEGKRARRWQQAFNAPSDGIYAKTKGPFNAARLDGYRHEFGSFLYAESDAEFCRLPEDLKDLVLHLIVAHHGGGRPVIETRGCEDAPPSALQQQASQVALHFARLQERWGPWGLAWWEALLRAADQQASRENDERSVLCGGR